MTLLITGGGGFVMSNLARRWLESDPGARVVVLDAAPFDALAERFFAPIRDRLEFVQGDVLEPASWRRVGEDGSIAHIVHGATITPSRRGKTTREAEVEQARLTLDVNIRGTINLLDWAARRPPLARFIYVSSGSVYGDEGPATPGAPLPEDGYVDPQGFYAVSKYASELIARRYAAQLGVPAIAVRLASVYGPMDRATPARSIQCVPYRMAHLALAGRPIRLNTLDGVGDWIHAGEVAEALARLFRAQRLRYPVYNIAYGQAVTGAELIGHIADKLPGTRHELVPEDRAEVVQDPGRRAGQWGAYDITRLTEDTGWRPRPLGEAFHDYIDWLTAYEFAPGAAPATLGGDEESPT